MAIALEFCNLIIPFANLQRANGDRARRILSQQRPGGGFIDLVEWYDDFLYRDGSMGGTEDEWLREWTAAGLVPLVEVDGRKYWKDLCIVNSGFGPTLPCDWLEYDAWNNCVYLQGKPRGLLVGRRGITETCDDTWADSVTALKAGHFRSALALIRSLAETGYPKAQNALGTILSTGCIMDRRILLDIDPAEGMQWFRRAAERGWWPSQLELIRSFVAADEVEAHRAQIAEWLASSSERPPRDPNLRESTRVEPFLVRSILHRTGFGFDLDPAKSLEWLRKAVDGDAPLAHLHLGMAFETGYAVPRDLAQARASYEEAGDAGKSHLERLDRGDAIAPGDLDAASVKLGKSHTAWQDPIAWFLLRPAARRGHAEAQSLLEHLRVILDRQAQG